MKLYPTLDELREDYERAVAPFKAGGFTVLTREQQAPRGEKCAACQFLCAGRCSVCGCQAPEKSFLPGEYCPAGKWPKIVVDAAPARVEHVS